MKALQFLAIRGPCAAALAVVAAGVAAQPATKASAKPSTPTVIDNCVTAAQLSFRPGVNGVVLDARDGADVAAAIVRRYPMIERDGLYPQAVALWRPPRGEWVYATLSQKAHAPHPHCYTANVDAGKVELTPTLIRKYFGPAP